MQGNPAVPHLPFTVLSRYSSSVHTLARLDLIILLLLLLRAVSCCTRTQLWRFTLERGPLHRCPPVLGHRISRFTAHPLPTQPCQQPPAHARARARESPHLSQGNDLHDMESPRGHDRRTSPVRAKGLPVATRLLLRPVIPTSAPSTTAARDNPSTLP
ncbi:hypothetical protein LZ32DRAFT_605350 [Colletotrichum eremochloae]|nr:hypothetical protein LZ32DRAFT_605350 [Colletotrichum eremochloae]